MYWGIIGAGNIAKKFAMAVSLTKESEIIAIASRDIQCANTFANQFGIHRAVSDLTELLDCNQINAVYIATPHAFHADIALSFLRNRKAVLCEKPLGLSARQVQTMIYTSKQHGSFLMEAMWTRFLPMFESVLEAIFNGSIGSVKYIRADFGFRSTFDSQSRLFDKSKGGGSLLDVGVYPIFLVLQILGLPDSIKAYAKLASTGVDETCHAILGYNSGASAIISSSIAVDTTLTAEIVGTKGSIKIPSAWYKQWSYKWQDLSGRIERKVFEPVENGFEYEIEEVTRCLSLALTESPRMPLSLSLNIAKVMDEIRSQIGVKYPNE